MASKKTKPTGMGWEVISKLGRWEDRRLRRVAARRMSELASLCGFDELHPLVEHRFWWPEKSNRVLRLTARKGGGAMVLECLLRGPEGTRPRLVTRASTRLPRLAREVLDKLGIERSDAD